MADVIGVIACVIAVGGAVFEYIVLPVAVVAYVVMYERNERKAGRDG